MIHFGKLVKTVAHSRNQSAEDLAALMHRDTSTVLRMYENEEWGTNDVRCVSAALNYDFGPHLDKTRSIQFFQTDGGENVSEVIMNIKFPKGKDELLYQWINDILQSAKNLGINVE